MNLWKMVVWLCWQEKFNRRTRRETERKREKAKQIKKLRHQIANRQKMNKKKIRNVTKDKKI